MSDSNTSVTSSERAPLRASEAYELRERPLRSPGITPEQLKAAAKVGIHNADRMQAHFRASNWGGLDD